MKLTRLLAPRSVAVVGASTRPGSYGNLAVANLVAAGFSGPVFGVHPSAAEVHGVPCVPRIRDLPVAPDAVVIATPAATVPALVAEAGEHGCGGAVVFAAGFAETAAVPGTGAVPAGVRLQEELVAAAARYDMPVCGPNGNGIVAVAARAPLWGDAYAPRRAGPVALISQSGNVAVNALLSTRALRPHTVVSCGNQAVVDAAAYLSALAETDGVRSVALYLEDEGDGARLATALAACADHGVRVAVLKAGTSPLGASAAAAHTGALAGDTRILRALIEEAGGAWAHNPHELLELAKTLAHAGHPRPSTPRPAPPGQEHDTLHRVEHAPASPVENAPRHEPPARARGVLIVTCSGGDAAVAADEAARHGIPLATLSDTTEAALIPVLPATATPGNPLDYTAVIFGDTRRVADLITVAASDESVGPVLVYYDRPARMPEDAAAEWDAALNGILSATVPGPLLVASTLPDLMPEAIAELLVDHGIVPVSGLTEGILCAGALLAHSAGGDRLRAIAGAASSPPAGGHPSAPSHGGTPMAEHEAKPLLREYGVSVPDGVVARTAEEAVVAAGRLGGDVALKLSGRGIRHKSDIGGVVLGLGDPEGVRTAATRLLGLPDAREAVLLVERMVAPGVELMVAVRRDGVVPVLAVALGGVWVEVLDDVVLVPLPVTPGRVAAAVRRLRGAALLTGGRGRAAADLDAFGELAARAAVLALTENLDLLELNPVIVSPGGATAVDAVLERA
ncbi:acetate--CoA ligase family protein [Sphaerisporangium aureirubrum]|uniref:Acetate--CoA ligase family protein n=1 Tax=Sphaerisporangium aureirubrum TaxID=1544736 RepID=A0ABW1NMC2_9ACTN